jgi:aryl-alcohol dehydrogenase-like predicted oxidoreductase
MKRRVFLGTALAGLPLTGAFAAQPKARSWDIPTVTLGRTGVKVQIIAQGGARMDLHPDIPTAAAYVRQVYELGLRYFDCARMYWNGQSEEAYGLGLRGIRNDVFLTSKSVGRTAKAAAADLETSLRLLKTDYVDLWQMHDIRTLDEVQAVLKPGGAMEAFEAAKKAGKCRLIGFTGHFDPEAHAAMLNAYDKWDTVMMPVHAADHAFLSFEQIALPVSVARGVPNQAIKVFGKANLLRSLSPSTCLRYALSQPGVQVAICGAGTVGQMEDNIRAVQSFRKMTPEESAEVRKRAIVGAGVYTGPTLEYWKKKA